MSAGTGLLAGCDSQSAVPLNASLTAHTCFDCVATAAKTPHGSGTVFALTTSGSVKILHRFGGSGDGANPEGGLIDINGTLYGTTKSGGTNGKGTVFAIAPSGVETVLHSFGASGDGSNPVATLIDVKGTLYGTTEYGGNYDFGTVFSITTSGIEVVLHSFKGSPHDGALPAGSLLDEGGTLYGTTQAGGAGSCEDFISSGSGVYGCGAVFKISTAGSEKLIYHFDGFHGWRPWAGLTNVGGTMYGTTVWLPHTNGAGSVFKITTSGQWTELYAFQGSKDAADPFAGLADVYGTLYGTTIHGGSKCGKSGCGTVFSITTSGGGATVLYRFKNSVDGRHPYAGLVNVNGTLYGTTEGGGAAGRGTVFTITPSGSEKVVHIFGRSPAGGKSPFSGLLPVKGELYGTTEYGGAP